MKLTDTVIIIGASHHNTYSMLRCFGEFGLLPDLILYGNSSSYILKSRFIANKYTAIDAADALSLLFKKYKKGIIISCTDEISSLLDKSYSSLKNHFVFFNCGSDGLLTQYMDKLQQTEIARKSGLRVPSSIAGRPCDILEDIDIISYPQLIKPLESIHGGKKIRICNDKESFEKSLKDFDPQCKVLAQDYISKESEIVILGLSVEGEIDIPGYILKYRDTLGGTTYARVNSISDLPVSLVTSCEKLVNMISYEGLFGIEMIKSKDDYYFIEINLRNDATTYALAKAGYNLPLTYYLKKTGQYNANNTSTITTINYMVELNDIIHVLKREISFLTWLKQLKGSQCKYCYCSSDKSAFWPQMGAFMKFLIQMIRTHGFHR